MGKIKTGYIQIYTGNGKGKTTAAIGLALRAAGHGMRICLIQFMKNYPYGEIKSLDKYKHLITLHRFGNDDFVFKKQPPSHEDLNFARQGLDFAEDCLTSKKYDIVILDEICVSTYFKIVQLNDVLSLISKKPDNVELILTGRYCPDELIEKADLVTEMKEIKHYYNSGVLARKGIES